MFRPLLLLACCSLAYCSASDAAAQSPYAGALALHQYRYVEYPRQVRRLEHLIRLRQAEIASLERRIAEWEPFDRFRDGRPLMVTIENARLALLEARLDLDCLQQDLIDLHRARRLRVASFYAAP